MLILAAFPPELEPFSERYRKDARTVGIGLVTAAHATGALLASLRPSAVVLVGSCGVYPGAALDRALPGAVVVASGAVLVDGAAVQGLAALPAPMVRRVDMDATWVDRFAAAGAARVIAAGTLGITTSDALAHTLAEQSGADVENMEAFSVAAACAAAAIPCVAVLGVTNVVGSEGRAQWREHHVAVAARVAMLVEATLK